MKKVIPVLILASLILGYHHSRAGAEETAKITKPALQQMYVDYLTAEGFKPIVDVDGDIEFKMEGLTYFIGVNEKDPQFFRIVLANIWPIENDEEREKVLAAANEASANTKVAKVFTVKKNVWVSIELFVGTPDEFKPIFKRSCSALSSAKRTFVDLMRK